jgi:hypothetical protein
VAAVSHHTLGMTACRLAGPLALSLLALASTGPIDRESFGSLFSSGQPVELRLEAPLQQLFQNGTSNEDYTVSGVVSYRGTGNDRTVVIPDVRVSVRGNTSKRETECTFPKLKLKFKAGNALDHSLFAGLESLKIGTHCGEAPADTLTRKFGRLANERAPWREALVYRLLAAIGTPTLRARPARVTYVDKSLKESGPDGTLTRNAMLLEDDEAAKARLGGSAEIDMETFGNARDRFRGTDTARLVFSEAMVGNFDWCLKMSPDDTYRCDERKPLWNVLAVSRGNEAFPIIKDFDLAGPVTGRHKWFANVYNDAFVPSRSWIDVEVLSQVQRTRSLFSRETLDAVRHEIASHRRAAARAIAEAAIDPAGRDLARRYVDSFFGAIATDTGFYRPVVVVPGTRVYVDAARSREACGAGNTVPVGTPVNERHRSQSMIEVVLLDVMWQWGPPGGCDAVRRGTVWIDAGAVRSDYPSASGAAKKTSERKH